MNSCCTCSNYSRHFTSVFKFCSHCKQESGKETHGVYNGSNQSECSSFSIFNQLRINTETTWESNALMIKIRLEAEMNFLLPTISLSLSQTHTHTHSHTPLVPIISASLMTQMVKNLPAMQETQVQSLGQENPVGKRMDTTPVFFPGKSHGQRSLVGYSSWGHRVRHDWAIAFTFHFQR